MNSEEYAEISRQFPAAYTSNDLLFSLRSEHSRKALNYETVAQSADEVQDVRNAPPISIGSYAGDNGCCLRSDCEFHVRLRGPEAIEIAVIDDLGMGGQSSVCPV